MNSCHAGMIYRRATDCCLNKWCQPTSHGWSGVISQMIGVDSNETYQASLDLCRQELLSPP